MIPRVCFLATLSGCLMAQLGPGDWRTDLSKKAIDLTELRRGGPPKDGIPSIDNPRLVDTTTASSWLSPKEPVLAIDLNGQARAYPSKS